MINKEQKLPWNFENISVNDVFYVTKIALFTYDTNLNL